MNDPKQSLEDFVAGSCTHGSVWLREGAVGLCPKCRRVREGTVTWSLEHRKACDWRPAPEGTVCLECAITWACSWAVSTAGATLERAAIEAENHGYDGRRAAAAIRALA